MRREGIEGKHWINYLSHGHSLCRRPNDGGNGDGIVTDFGNSVINGDNDRLGRYQRRMYSSDPNPKSEIRILAGSNPKTRFMSHPVPGAKPEDKENFNRS